MRCPWEKCVQLPLCIHVLNHDILSYQQLLMLDSMLQSQVQRLEKSSAQRIMHKSSAVLGPDLIAKSGSYDVEAVASTSVNCNALFNMFAVQMQML